MTPKEIANAIGAIDGDKALLSCLKALLKETAPNFMLMTNQQAGTLTPFPDPTTITAAQMSVFDNWIEFGGHRPKRGEAGHNRDRWKATFQVWTQPAAELDLRRHRPTFYGVAHLWTGKEIIKRHSGSNKALKLPKALSDSFKAQLATQAVQMTDERLGLVYSPDGGYYLYHDEMYVGVGKPLDDHKIDDVLVSSPAGDFVFTGFTVGAAAQNCFAHARMTVVPNIAKSWNAVLIG